MSIDSYTAAVSAGPGLVLRDCGVVLLVPGSGGPVAPETAALLRAFAQPLDPTGRRTVRAVAALLGQAAPADVPAFAAVLDTDRGLVVLVHADAEVVVQAGQPVRLSGNDSLAWVERRFEEPVQSLELSAGPSTQEIPPAAAVPGVIPFDLIRGTVPGGAVHLRDGAAKPVPPINSFSVAVSSVIPPAENPAENPAEDPGDATEEIPLPVPIVEGALCSRGHFNDPDAAFCAVCGIAMHQASRELVAQPRAPLGVMILDDGTAFSLDGDVVLGRDPAQHAAVQAGLARPLTLNDDINGVSRIHARISLAEWSVRISDEGSANGTYLSGPAGTGPAGTCAVGSGHAVTLTNGAVLRIGRRSMTFHSYHAGGE